MFLIFCDATLVNCLLHVVWQGEKCEIELVAGFRSQNVFGKEIPSVSTALLHRDFEPFDTTTATLCDRICICWHHNSSIITSGSVLKFEFMKSKMAMNYVKVENHSNSTLLIWAPSRCRFRERGGKIEMRNSLWYGFIVKHTTPYYREWHTKQLMSGSDNVILQ